MDNETEGFPITAIREIKILKELDHKNIVRLKEIVTSKASSQNNNKGSVYMVFEYMDHDLNGLMDSPVFKFFNPEQIKCYLKQLLEGLDYCHRNNVLHRDIKGSNLLLNNKGILKLADFGLARPFNSSEKKLLTERVITLWYRPPELLLGSQNYGPEVDMWSVGCIMAELLSKKTLFPGRSTIDQLDKIYQICGTPTKEIWPEAETLPHWDTLKPKKTYKRILRDIYANENKAFFTTEALDLLDKLLCLNPKQRISASDALDNPYFWTQPLPCEPSSLPSYPSCGPSSSQSSNQPSHYSTGGRGPISQQSNRLPPSQISQPLPPHMKPPHNYHQQPPTHFQQQHSGSSRNSNPPLPYQQQSTNNQNYSR
eukprot:gene13201-16105_t